jgi:general secretion pathway protein A
MEFGAPTGSAGAVERAAQQGLPLQTILELEQTARLLAILLDSGRAVINDNQALFDDQASKPKPLSLELFERQLTDIFRARAGTDLQELGSAGIPDAAKRLLKELAETSKQVVALAQSDADRAQPNGKAFIPAVFGERAATRFSARTGVRLKQTALTPRNPANAPDSFERAALEAFAEPAYPHEKVISEITAKGKTIRLMFPLYTTRQCLNCHGEPKGSLDRMGYPREGLRLGQNAGAISVILPVTK